MRAPLADLRDKVAAFCSALVPMSCSGQAGGWRRACEGGDPGLGICLHGRRPGRVQHDTGVRCSQEGGRRLGQLWCQEEAILSFSIVEASQERPRRPHLQDGAAKRYRPAEPAGKS